MAAKIVATSPNSERALDISVKVTSKYCRGRRAKSFREGGRQAQGRGICADKIKSWGNVRDRPRGSKIVAASANSERAMGK